MWDDPAPVWQLVDLCNALMALPNLAALLLLAPRALSLLDQWRTLPTFNIKKRRDFTRAEYDKMKSAGQIPYSRSGRGKLSP